MALAGVLWVVALALGFYLLGREQFTPIAQSPHAQSFPENSRLTPEPGKPLLLFFAHPHCPCTRASLHELGRVVAETGDRVSVWIVFTIPEGVDPGWENGGLIDLAAKIPGARVFKDQNGEEAHRFGIQGSGEVLLYNPARALLFSGGITPSRGHEGDSPGQAAIVDFVLQGHAPLDHTPAFGCSLFSQIKD